MFERVITVVKVPAIELKKLTKRFGSVTANNQVDLTLYHGEVLSLLGENGSGKTTLMNMIAGIYMPDHGQILVDGKPVSIRSPKDAYDNGIGMIHQHFKLVDVFTAAENIVLGLKDKNKLNRKEIGNKVREISEKYGFHIDPEKKVYDMSVSEKQTVEIMKVLYRGANILILDEPTAVLTDQESDRLFDVLRAMRADGKAVVIITHKMHEVMGLSDRVAVLRKGEYIGTLNTAETNPQELTEMMVGHTVALNINRPEPINPEPRLVVDGLTVCDHDGVVKLDHATFTAHSGEILGIAGIAGSGQKELLEAIAGLQKASSGSVIYKPAGKDDSQLLGKTPLEIKREGVAMAFVPEDRLGMGLVGGMGMTDNMLLRSWREGKGLFLRRKSSDKLAKQVKDHLEVVTPSIDFPVRRLSGGNVQKVLVGREIASAPGVLMTAYAVRGLDIHTSYTIYNLMTEEKEKGVAVVFAGEDLDVLLELCDRVMVMCGGKITGIVDARTATKEELGRLMIESNGKEMD